MRYLLSKNFRINKYFYVIAFCVFLLGAHISAASEAFKNSLVKMDFSNISGGIQVKLYTNKPYGDSISVNKKSDSEYVILMPETSNSMTANPILNPVSGVVRGVSVKTQQYDGNIKGYTKITISTLKPIEIVTQLKTINASSYQLSENDYSELLAQTAKKTQPVAPKKVAAKPIVVKKEAPKTVQKPAEVKTAQQKTVSNLPAQKTKKTETKQTPVLATKPKQAANLSKAAEKPVVKEVKKPVSKHVSQPIESAKPVQEAKPTKATNVPSSNPPVPLAQTAPSVPAIQPQVPTSTQSTLPASKPLTFGQKIINVTENPQRLAKYKDMLLSNIYVILGGALVVFLILLLGARKMTKSMRKEKEVFAKNLSDKPAPKTNFMDKINDNMTWKEKYQTYVETANQPAEQDIPAQPTETFEEPFEADNELNELFAVDEKVNTQETSDNKGIDNENEQYAMSEDDLLDENDIPRNEISQGEEIFGKDKLDELFGADENILNEEKSFINEEKSFIGEDFSFDEAYEEAEMSSNIAYSEEESNDYEYEDYDEPDDEEIKSEYVIDATKGFYLVDYRDKTSLIGHIGDEIFVLKQFGEKIDGALQARLDEHKGTSANYMTRVGRFKALVEVKPDYMNLLIEL